MGEDSPKPASTPTGAVFLSYASQDASAAQRICEALRAAAIEVWFDQTELRGGDAWDHKIRDQIHDCRLFVPVISANTERRDEGYFRREWSLAVDRTRDMDHKRTFLVPVVIDGTAERGAAVPDKFHELQWTRLPDGETPPAFVDRILRLLTPGVSAGTTGAAGRTSEPTSVRSARRLSLHKAAIWGASAAAAVACVYLVADKFWLAKHRVASAPTTVATAPQMAPSAGVASAFDPPPRSIVVLPFVNLSGDKGQEYFSDGVTEELITALSQVSALRVIARTSAFAFKGKNVEVETIARRLNVASILEGSVRRAGSTVRVTVQLIDARTGYHVWSQDYDRKLTNLLAMQTDIATAVASHLQAALTDRDVSRVGLGDTDDPEARDAYLRAVATIRKGGANSWDRAILLMEEATRRDPRYARAWVSLSYLYMGKDVQDATGPSMARARMAAETALQIAPQLPSAHALRARIYARDLDWSAALREVEVANSLDPTDPATLRARMNLDYELGRWQEVIDTARLAIGRDPLELENYDLLGAALFSSGQYRAAQGAWRELVVLSQSTRGHGDLATALLLDNRPEEALSEAEQEPAAKDRNTALALIYHALGRHDESDRMLASVEQKYPLYAATIRAYRGETDLAFQCLDRAVDQRDPSLYVIKGNLGIFPNISRDPRYAELLTKIGLPVGSL
jgi:TolB-like protein/tetratricopeptide (TPR) repeat protein